MRSEGVSSFLVKADKICDYCPVLSSCSNLVDLCYKSFVFSSLNKTQIQQDRYYQHLDQKSVFRCLILMVPILGNVLIALCDFISWIFTDSKQPSPFSDGKIRLSLFGNQADEVYEQFRLRSHRLAEATGRCVIDRGEERPIGSDFHYIDEAIMPLNTSPRKCLERVRSVVYVS